MNGQEWFRILVGSPDPRKRIRELPEGPLSAAIDEIEAVECPNNFHKAIYAMLVGEALLRWRSGLLSLDSTTGGNGDR